MNDEEKLAIEAMTGDVIDRAEELVARLTALRALPQNVVDAMTAFRDAVDRLEAHENAIARRGVRPNDGAALVRVLDAMLELDPKLEPLRAVRTSATYAAPEMMEHHWARAASFLACRVPTTHPKFAEIAALWRVAMEERS